MANYVIRQGSHRALPLVFGIYFGKKSMTRKVIFHEDCRYDLGNENQQDWNKLFGLGYLWSLHTDSARFAWRYSVEKDCIEIGSYAYVDGERVMEYICDMGIGEQATMSLLIFTGLYQFEVYLEDNLTISTIPKTNNKKISYKLGLYFGGNEVAPHDMRVMINKP